MTRFNAAVVQMRSTTDIDENLASLDALVRQAADMGADYVQTPEMTGLVQQNRKAFFATAKKADEDPVFEASAELARELGITLHIGSTPIILSDSQAANRAALFAPDGSLIETYDKIHMFDVDLDNGESWRESAVYQPGTRAVIAPVCGALMGMGICYDIRFPELYRNYACSGAEVLTAPACFTRQTGRAHWHVLQRSRAIENGAFMISAAQGGDHQDGRATFGHSIIVDPWGEVLAEVSGEKPGVAMAIIDTQLVHQARQKIPNLKNVRPFELLVKQPAEQVA